MNCHYFILTLTIIYVSFSEAYIPQMLNGRPRDGFLGNPGGIRKVDSLPSKKWFVQPLNHFDQSDTRTWKQKYFVSDTFYKTGGPLFVQIGGEGPASPIWVVSGAWMDYAKKYNAYCILVEHRYYGDSHPTANMSTANLKYLSSEQALADLANVVSHFKTQLNGAKVIVFGGSYSGALSAWFRMKYPYLAHGAIASSAPVLAKVNFQEFLNVVSASLDTYGGSGSCDSDISVATALFNYFLSHEDGRQKLQKMFKLCSDIDIKNEKDISNLYSTLADNIIGVVQYNKDNRAFEGGPGSNITIDTICDIMTNQDLGDPLDRYAAVNSLMLKTYQMKCRDFKYGPMIKDMQDVSWDSSVVGGRQWVYQTCTEFAFYQSSDGWNQPFGHHFPIKFSTDQCADIYGPEFTEALIAAAVKETNIHYGGLDLKVTRVLFPNGSIDPWHALGILKDLNPDAKAIYINGTAHCANMYPPSPHDLPGLKAARAEIMSTIGQWLSE